MSYTIDEVNQAIAGFARSEAAAPAWLAFYDLLNNSEAVKLYIGQAMLQDDQGSAKYDSYGSGYVTGDVSFIFSVDNAGGTRRYFKKTGYLSSYEADDRFSGGLTEVAAAGSRIHTTWKAI